MRYVSVFSGIEAASVAWAPLGWDPVCFSEVDEFPSAVLKHRYPHVPNLGDITQVDWRAVRRESGSPDVVVGGSPCQSFSVAGKREGLRGASGLMWEYVRAVRELLPRWVLWENVPGALSSSHGEDFRCLLEALDALGYGLAWRVLDAQFFGVAQRRERVFLVGRLGDVEGPCQVLFEPEGLQWDPPSSREKRQELAAGAGAGAARADGALNPADPQSKRVYDPEGCAPTLPSGTGEGMNIQPSVLCAAFKYHQGSGAGSIGYERDQSPTLTADYHNPAVMCLQDTQTNAAVVAVAANQRGEYRVNGDGSYIGSIPASQSGKQFSGVSGPGYVRRLTPRECERLQGFPDDWTLVPYRGKPAEECPDTPRYKAIGNSMSVPVMRWIGERIQGVEEERHDA